MLVARPVWIPLSHDHVTGRIVTEEKTELIGLYPEELESFVETHGLPLYRATYPLVGRHREPLSAIGLRVQHQHNA